MKKLTFILVLLAALPAQASEAVVSRVQEGYRTQGAGDFSAERGRQMWTQQHTDQQTGKPISCATCHTENLRQAGSHARTGKRIEPMAASANPEGLNDPKKIEKWFLRNCKGTLGRECTPQEKGDFLSYFLSE